MIETARTSSPSPFRQIHFMLLAPQDKQYACVAFPDGSTMNLPDIPNFPADAPVARVSDWGCSDEMHIALGRFIDAWGNLELVAKIHFEFLLGVGFGPAAAISNQASGRSLMDLIAGQLDEFEIDEQEVAAFEVIKERYKRLNTKRNYIIHGFWAGHAVVDTTGADPKVQIEPMREYFYISKAGRKALNDPNNQKQRSKYLFDIKSLIALRSEVEQLSDDLTNYITGMKLKDRFNWGKQGQVISFSWPPRNPDG